MPRTLASDELFKYLTDLSVYRQVSGGGNTSLAAALTIGAAQASIAATTSFTTGDPIIINGTGGIELNAIAGTLAVNASLAQKAAFAQAVGATVVEAVRQQLGYLEEGGPIFSPSQQLTPIFSSISRGAIEYLYGPGEMEMQVGLLGFNGLNLHTILGITEAEAGTGASSSDPYTAPVQGLQMGTQGIQCFRLTGIRFDGKTVQFDCNGAKAVASGQVNLNGKTPASMPMSLRFTSAVLRYW